MTNQTDTTEQIDKTVVILRNRDFLVEGRRHFVYENELVLLLSEDFKTGLGEVEFRNGVKAVVQISSYSPNPIPAGGWAKTKSRFRNGQSRATSAPKLQD